MKKLLSVLLIIVMVFSMTITSFASEVPNEVPQFTMIEVELDYDNAVEIKEYEGKHLVKELSFNDNIRVAVLLIKYLS